MVKQSLVISDDRVLRLNLHSADWAV